MTGAPFGGLAFGQYWVFTGTIVPVASAMGCVAAIGGTGTIRKLTRPAAVGTAVAEGVVPRGTASVGARPGVGTAFFRRLGE